MKQIAARLNVSPRACISGLATSRSAGSIERETFASRVRSSPSAGSRSIDGGGSLTRRRAGRARSGDALHQAGCMLYWAEGGKDRGLVSFANSDRAMVTLFWRFLRSNFTVDRHRLRVRPNVYLTNGLCLRRSRTGGASSYACREAASEITSPIITRPRAAAESETSCPMASAPSGCMTPASSSTSTARSRSTEGLRNPAGSTGHRGRGRSHSGRGELSLSRAATRAAPSAREGGSRPDPRPPSARHRARPR
jgi:hypothetical protein